MSLCSLLSRRCFPIASRIQPLCRSFHNLNAFSTPEPNSSTAVPSQPENTQILPENAQFSTPFNPNSSQFTPDSLSPTSFNFTPLSRSQGFLSAEEAAAERRRRKRRLRIEPPIQIGQRPPPLPRDPRQPDSTSALTGPRLNLHNRVQSLIRAFDLEAASKLARSAVHGRTRPTVFTCNAIIAAMHRAKRYEESKSLFSYFFEHNTIVPNVVSYNYLINSLCDEGNADEARSVYKRIIAEAPFGPSHVTYRHLTKGLVDSKRIEEAVELLREMLIKGHGADSLVYNNLIKGYLDLGNIPRADEFFNELKERCLVYDGVVNATYMEFWFEQGNEKEAMESYKSLLDKKYRMVPATCNVLLSVLLKYGKKDQAWALFENMLDDHTPPTFQAVNTETFNIMVNECFKEGKVEKAVETFRMSGKKVRSKPFAMEVATYNNMIARFCEIDKPKEAETYFDELCSKSLNPDVLSFKTLIDAYLELEQVDDAVKYLTRMVDSGLRVVASYGVGVFEKLLVREKFDEVFRILSAMGEKEPKPDFPVYEVVVKGFCDAGEIGKVEEILKQMMTHSVIVPSSLKEVVRNVFENEGKGKEIEDILDETKWRNLRCYNNSGRQSSVSLQPNRFQTSLMSPVSNFTNRNDSLNSFSGQSVQSSNQQPPWTANNVALFSQPNGESFSPKKMFEVVRQIGSHYEPLNPPKIPGVKNGDQWPREDKPSIFYGSKSVESHLEPLNQQYPSWNNVKTQHQSPSYQPGQSTENLSVLGSPENSNGLYPQPSNPQSSWNLQGRVSTTNFPVEENPLNYNRVHHQPSNSQSSWNIQGGKDATKFPEETNSWNYNVASQQPSNQQNPWNYQGGSIPGKWPGEEHFGMYHQSSNPSQNTLNFREPKPIGVPSQPSYQQNSQTFHGQCPPQWSEKDNTPNYYQSTKPVGPYKPSNPSQNSLNFHEPKPVEAHHQPSTQQNSRSFQRETFHQWSEKENSQNQCQTSRPVGSHYQPLNHTQNSLNFQESKPNGAPHWPSNQQISRSFPGETFQQWPADENSQNLSQTSNPVGSYYQPLYPSQKSSSFHEPKPIGAHHQPSNQQNSESFQGGSLHQWPEKKNAQNLFQTTNPDGSHHQPSSQQTSWSHPGNFYLQEDPLKNTKQNPWSSSDTKSPKWWPEDGQSSSNSGIPNASHQQSSLYSNENNSPTDVHPQHLNQPSNFWKEETKHQTDSIPRKTQGTENKIMSPILRGERWRPPPPMSTQHSSLNIKNKFQFDKESQGTVESGNWFAEGVTKTLRRSDG